MGLYSTFVYGNITFKSRIMVMLDSINFEYSYAK
jgi:hypothetical protein